MNMRNKCEWKDGKYNPCKAAYEHYIDLGKPYDPYWNNKIQRGYKVNFCPFCGADIRRPSEQPDDWKILDVNCLPDGDMVNDYEFYWEHQGEKFVIFRIGEEMSFRAFFKTFINSIDKQSSILYYRFKKTKKTDEELFVNSVTKTCDFSENVASARGYNRGFIAGRKSMESNK